MPRPKKATEAKLASKEHLVRVLCEQLERTFSSEGQAAALKLMADLLRRLDGAALRELAYLQGLTTEFERETEADEE